MLPERDDQIEAIHFLALSIVGAVPTTCSNHDRLAI